MQRVGKDNSTREGYQGKGNGEKEAVRENARERSKKRTSTWRYRHRPPNHGLFLEAYRLEKIDFEIEYRDASSWGVVHRWKRAHIGEVVDREWTVEMWWRIGARGG